MPRYRKNHERIIHKKEGYNLTSHYEERQLQEAMRLIYRLLPIFETATFNVAGIIQYMKQENDIQTLWMSQLANRIIPIFLKDNPTLFPSDMDEQITQATTSDRYMFFTHLSAVLNDGNLSQYRLMSQCTTTDEAAFHAQIHPGWATVLTEFGLFGALGTLFHELFQELAKPQISAKHLSQVVEKKCIQRFVNISNQNKTTCLAKSHVEHHIAFHFLLNASLARLKYFTPATRVNLLTPEGGYVKPDVMAAQYDSRLLQFYLSQPRS